MFWIFGVYDAILLLEAVFSLSCSYNNCVCVCVTSGVLQESLQQDGVLGDALSD